MALHYGKHVQYPDGSGHYIIYNRPIDTWDAGPKKAKKRASVEFEEEGEANARDNEERACRRAKRTIRDYILCNEFTHFVTLTYQPRYDTDESRYDRLQNWLKYMRKKYGSFNYVLIPERDKKGKIHFHGVVDLEKFELVPAENKGRPLWHKGKKVYNMLEWESTGYSTATVIKDKRKVAGYATKYITKNFADTVGKNKKKYWCSKGLSTPVESSLKVIPQFNRQADWENDYVKIYNIE